jgi:hypothetical protein
VDDGVGRDNAELTRVHADNLELDRAETEARAHSSSSQWPKKQRLLPPLPRRR